MNLGPMELLLIGGILLLLFGPSRLPSLGKSIGQAIRSFKKGLNTDSEIDVTDASKEAQEKLKESDQAASHQHKTQKESQRS